MLSGAEFRCNDFSGGIEIEGTDFVPFSAKQYQQLEQLLPVLVTAYPTWNLEHITGHEHIAPGRKTDPGHSSTGNVLAALWV